MTTIKDTVLTVLQKARAPMPTNDAIVEVAKVFNRDNIGPTVARALRKLFQEGEVDRSPADMAKPTGPKLWTSRTPCTKPNPNSKVTIMTLPANKPTLTTATIQTIDYLISQKASFTAHDVTHKLRELIKDGLALVDDAEVGTVFAYNRKVPKIEHESVKPIVHEYFLAGKMPDTYERQFSVDHWAYNYIDPQAVPVPPVGATPPMPTASDDYDGDPLL